MKLVATGNWTRISGTRRSLSEEAVKSENGRDLTAATTTTKAGVRDGSGGGERSSWFEFLALTSVRLMSATTASTTHLSSIFGKSPFWARHP